MKNKYYFLFIILFLITFFLRFWQLDKIPASLNWDEVSHGYNAYSILKTAKDEWGIKLPLIFRAYGDYKLPLYIYLSTPFVAIFGLNAFSIRLLSILAGSILPFIIFLIVKKILPKQNYVAIIALLITVFSPSTVFLSRIALEANLFLLIFFISVYFLITKKYSLSSFFYALSLFTYNSSRVILPFYLIILLFLIIRNKYPLKKNIHKFLFLFLTILIFAFQTFQSTGQARYKWVTLIDQGAINQINELRPKYSRILVNKITFFIYSATKNYIAHFNPSYLFFKGGSHYQFSLPNFYLISPFFLPFLIIGLYKLFTSIRKNNLNNFLIIFFCLLIAPLPSSITRDAPHVLRSIVFIPSVIIVISLSFANLKKKNSLLALLFISLVLLFSQFKFWHQYQIYAKDYSSSWQHGYQEAIFYIKENYHDYDQIIFTKKYGEPHEFILFHWPWDPSSYQEDSNLKRDFYSDWYWVDSFDKFKFINDWDIKKETENITKKTLLISSPDNYNINSYTNLIKTINFLDKKPAFDILSIHDQKQ